ncbi:unnamed protein product [Parajaminaea phylloscopi]
MNTKALLVAVTLALSAGVHARPTQPVARDGPPAAVRKAPAAIPTSWKQNGAAPADTAFTYTLHLKSAKADELDAKLLDIAQSGGEWLTLDQLKVYTAVDDSVKTTVAAALTAHGVKQEDIVWSATGDAATVKSTVAQASQIFGADFHDYTYKGQSRKVRTHEYTLPSALADHVLEVSPFTQFSDGQKERLRTTRRLTTRGYAKDTLPLKDGPESCHHGFDGRQGSVTPACRGDLYGTTGITGKADDPLLGIFALSPEGGFDDADLTGFLQKYNPAQAGYKTSPGISLRGAPDSPVLGDEEAALDIDTAAGTLAPMPISFVVAPENGDDFFADTFQDLIASDRRPAVLSMSYGIDESQMTQAQADTMCNYAKQLTALGTTIVVASGDNGVNGGHPEEEYCPPFKPTYPSGCQYVLSVGATVGFPERSTSFVDDEFWGGGGFTNFFPVPSWQKNSTEGYLKAYGTKNAGQFNSAGRGFPDVSAQGIDYPILSAGKLESTGGTSASAPAVASVLSLINSLRKAAGKGTLGWVTPLVYQHPDAWNDVTGGGSFGCGDLNAETQGFNSTTGWDPSSGVGTPNFPKLRAVFGV